MTKRIQNFSSGLYVSGPPDMMPEGTLRRAKSTSPLSQRSVKSRNGSSALVALTVNQAHYFNNLWWYFLSASGNIQVGDVNSIGTSISSGLGDDRPTFMPAPPVAGIQDHLFVCAESKLIKFDPGDFSVVEAGAWSWTVSGSGTNEYYLRTAASADPAIDNPEYVVEVATTVPNVMSIGTVGSLAIGQWVYDDNDALGYDTIYVRLTDVGTPDPDSHVSGYITLGRGFGWGIDAPSQVPTLADGGAAGELEDGAVYKYRITYSNSRTLTRSNPSPLGDTETTVLLHLDNATTDNSTYARTVTNNGGTFDAGNKKFGTHSWEGTGPAYNDYLSTPHTPELNFEGGRFTVDFWFATDAEDVAKTHHWLLLKQQDASNYWGIRLWTQAAPTDDAIIVTSVVNGKTEFNIGTDSMGDLANTTFYHCAVIRGWEGDPNRWSICFDGTSYLTFTYTGWLGNDGPLWLGGDGGANGLNGWLDEYRITKGRALWTENFTPPTAASFGSETIDLTAGQDQVAISGIPTSTDAQVDRIELWRTVADGAVYFYNTSIPAGDTTYTDSMADADLSSEELPLDNIKPSVWFSDCWYHNASVFWITRTQAGQRGRLYYSPIGRAEAVEGFINVTNDDDIIQRVVGYAGQLFVITESGVWQILGTNPYTARAVPGIPGTTKPYTVAITNVGPVWEAEDGIHLFRGGSSSEYPALDPVRDLFRGVTTGGISGFSGTIATYGRGEYYISDGTTTLALDMNRRIWREPGLAATGLAYSRESDQLLLGITNKALDYEKEGTTADDSSTYTFTVETPQFRSETDSKVVVQHVTVDADTTNESLTATLIYDDGATLSLGTLQTNGRLLEEFPVGKEVRNYGLRLSGSIDAAVEVFEVSFETHEPKTEGR